MVQHTGPARNGFEMRIKRRSALSRAMVLDPRAADHVSPADTLSDEKRETEGNLTPGGHLRLIRGVALTRLTLSMVAFFAFFFSLTGCSARPAGQLMPASDSGPMWSEPLIREHLRFFNSAESEGRGTGTRGYARVAAYVAARMSQFGLQPVMHNDYRVVYRTPVNTPLYADLIVESDSTRFIPGVDFILDARSDSGLVDFRHVTVAGSNEEPLRVLGESSGVLVARSAGATVEFLEEARDRGHLAVFLVGPLRPTTAARPVKGLLVVQLTENAAREMLGSGIVQSLGAKESRGQSRISEDIRIRVFSEYRDQAGAVNVMGYLAGKLPIVRDELVLVCADLDAAGSAGDVQTLDLRHLGVSSAALLEVARSYATSARRQPLPQRTLLFAVFSGALLEDAGLRAYLKSPLWPLDRTVAVVYMGLHVERETTVRNLLAEYGIQLLAIPPAERPLSEHEPVLMAGSADRRDFGVRDQGTTGPGSLSRIMEEAVTRARAGAEETHRILYRLSAEADSGLYLPATRLLYLE